MRSLNKWANEAFGGEPSITDVEAFWDSRPCNIRHSSAERGSRKYFDEVEQRRHFTEPHEPKFAEFDKWDGRRVLEVGCGIGTDGAQFAKAGAQYVGLDLSAASLEIARQRFAVMGLQGQFHHLNIEALKPGELGTVSFDLIYSFGVLHHTPDPLRALRNLRRVAHDETELRVMLYARHSWKAAMIEAGLDQPEAQSGCPLAETFGRDQATHLISSAGFRVKSVQQAHIFPWRIENYKHHEYVMEPWFASMPDSVFKALEQHLGWHLLILAQPT